MKNRRNYFYFLIILVVSHSRALTGQQWIKKEKHISNVFHGKWAMYFLYFCDFPQDTFLEKRNRDSNVYFRNFNYNLSTSSILFLSTSISNPNGRRCCLSDTQKLKFWKYLISRIWPEIPVSIPCVYILLRALTR